MFINVQYLEQVYVFYDCSEEDISTLKSSLYLFKKISQIMKSIKGYENLVQLVIRLILVAASRVLSNSEISVDKLTEIKQNVTNCLKATLSNVSTIKITISNFILQHEHYAKLEIQVRFILFIVVSVQLLLIIFNFLVLD